MSKEQKHVWEVIHGADEKDGTPNLWACQIHNNIVWIERWGEQQYDIVVGSTPKLKSCKSLTAAKQWVSKNL